MLIADIGYTNTVFGIIAHGFFISHDALVRHSVKLNKIPIKKTKYVIGSNTKSSMQIGFYLGYINLINGINVFKDQINFKNFTESYLTLNALYFIGKKKYA